MTIKDYIQNIDNAAERRFYTEDIELREEGESRKIRGYAAVFNKESEDFGWFVERVAPGAFDDVLNDDVVALFNHDPNFPLARKNAGLTIGVDKKGLWYEFDAPDTTVGNDLLKNIRAKIIRQSSFAFTIAEESWDYKEKDKGPNVRTIKKVKRLYDVSPVTYPAYPDTTVAARSFKSGNDDYQKDLAEMDLQIMKRHTHSHTKQK
jgi:hypothetical protein